jgi:hypothetical protein
MADRDVAFATIGAEVHTAKGEEDNPSIGIARWVLLTFAHCDTRLCLILRTRLNELLRVSLLRANGRSRSRTRQTPPVTRTVADYEGDPQLEILRAHIGTDRITREEL